MSNKHDLADRMEGIQPFYVMDLLAYARKLEAQGRHIIHMEIGEPDFPTPDPIRLAAQNTLKTNPIHYTSALGLPELRQAISDFYQQRYQLEIPATRIVITPGASGALQLVMGILVNADDAVLMGDPGYPCNRHFVRLFGGDAISVPVGADSHYQPNRTLLEQYWAEKTRAIMIASPSNPTGSLIPVEQLKEIYTLAQERSAELVVDEIYHGLTYAGSARSALELGDSVFVINSFSKYFGMTGWRLGWIVAPEWAIDALDRLAQNLFLAAPTLSQHAALAAFSPETLEILEQRKAAFKERRDYLIPALRALGFDIPEEPQGAFYIYANSTRFSQDSFSFCRQILNEVGVAITPGKDFGSYAAADHVRFAYTSEMKSLQEGVRRLEEYLTV
jgi:aspartate/methionine/tyrosine aminotransferase